MSRISHAAAIWILTGACDNRPDVEVARADFNKRYHDAIALDVILTEDEIVARSFRIRYRVTTSGREGTLGFQYMEDDAGRWVIRPEPPSQLP
jgi:hypothetical protein